MQTDQQMMEAATNFAAARRHGCISSDTEMLLLALTGISETARRTRNELHVCTGIILVAIALARFF